MLLMGPPGGGKGTISKKIARDFKFVHVSTGDMLRAQVQRGSTIGNEAKRYMDAGALVPDQLIADMVLQELKAKPSSRILLDGFPRTSDQAEILEKHVKVNMAANLLVPNGEIEKRVSARWVHPASGRMFAYDFNPPRELGKDDETGEPLVQRDDDKPEAVHARLEGYNVQTLPVLEFYRSRGLLVEFSGEDNPDLIKQDRRSDAIYKSLKPLLASKL